MVQMKFLAGGFSTFIATYVFDSDAGTLSLTKNSTTGTNPSWIVGHPTNEGILYATNENSPVGDLQSLTVDGDGACTVVDTVTSGGNAPTFAAVLSGGEVTAMNFGSPNASFVATDPNDPTKFVKDSPIVSFPREEGLSHPHMSLEVGSEVLVPDLGADKIWRLGKDGNQFSVKGQIDVDAGAGPRHIAMQDDVLLTVHELTSTLTAQKIPEGPNGTTNAVLANVSTVAANPLNGTKFAAAEIFVSPVSEKFPDQLIYVSNRNIGETIDPAGDTIAIFQLVNGSAPAAAEPAADAATRRNAFRIHSRHFPRQEAPQASLQLIAQVPTGLQQIRSMALGPQEGGGDEFIVAGANTNGGVSVFRRTDGGKNLELVANNQDTQNRTSFVFL